jgi:cleavage and polyadenylation specificity factor subunit 4
MVSFCFILAALCRNYLRGHCPQGAHCPYRHPSSTKKVVCKHWLRGLCKKGESCEFLHEYNMRKMPECWFFTKYGECSNPDCVYLHVDPASKVKECAWFARGFCKHGTLIWPMRPFGGSQFNLFLLISLYGPRLLQVVKAWWIHFKTQCCGICRVGPDCKSKHVKKAPCLLYLAGFCPDGPSCINGQYVEFLYWN